MSRFGLGFTNLGAIRDPYFADVLLLLHGDGANGGSTFTDNSPGARTLSVGGNPVTSTSSPKFGTASISFDGTGDYLYDDDTTYWDFGTGDYTLETWIWPQAGSSDCAFMDMRTSTSNNEPYLLLQSSGTHIAATIDQSTRFTATGITTGAWHHVALTRASSICRMFVDGVQIGTTYTQTGGLTSCRLTLGTYIDQRNGGSSFHLTGKLDDVRITKGVARYTAGFTPPAAPFPNS